MTDSRRDLSFDNLDDVALDAKQLLESGYSSVGNWNLSQTCSHLSDWMTFPIEGFPKSPFPLSIIFWLYRNTIGPSQLKKYIAQGSMPAGLPTDPRTVAEADAVEDATAVERLCQAIDRFKNHEGPLHGSPIFGAIDFPTATKLQLSHCKLHLSFLISKTSEAVTQEPTSSI